MDNNFEKKNYTDKSIVIISGVSIDRTPVIKSFINFYSNRTLIALEYQHGKRFRFVLNAIFRSLQNRNKHIFFVGIQTLPIIFLMQFIIAKYFYWELESYSAKDNSSFVLRMLNFKKFIKWQKVRLILPSPSRLDKDDKRKINRLIIIPNVPSKGNTINLRRINTEEQIRLIFYGNLNNSVVYTEEWIKFVSDNPSLSLLLIGRDIDKKLTIKLPANAKYISQINHDELLVLLQNYHFSIVGYRPIDFNHKFCSPNKLFESFSLTLPVIANSQNPTLVEIIDETNAGMLIDFDKNLNKQINVDFIYKSYSYWSSNAFLAYNKKYHFENFANPNLTQFLC